MPKWKNFHFSHSLSMHRYFFEIAYDGTDFSGWQSQNNAQTVQAEIESALFTLTRNQNRIVGCGRTDTGVHASQYFFHYDIESWNDTLSYKLNAILPKSITINSFSQVKQEAHARFDAKERQYTYFAHYDKNPFKQRFSSYIVSLQQVSLEQLNQVAKILFEFEEFYPFCKSNHDAKTLKCDIREANWIQTEDGSFQFKITSNRFLRGMVRLIVGACINVALGKTSSDEIIDALENQTRLSKSLSVPAEGLFLSKIAYSEDIFVI